MNSKYSLEKLCLVSIKQWLFSRFISPKNGSNSFHAQYDCFLELASYSTYAVLSSNTTHIRTLLMETLRSRLLLLECVLVLQALWYTSHSWFLQWHVENTVSSELVRYPSCTNCPSFHYVPENKPQPLTEHAFWNFSKHGDFTSTNTYCHSLNQAWSCCHHGYRKYIIYHFW